MSSEKMTVVNYKRRVAELEAEVARLRELAEHRGKSLVKQLDATLAETRAHEATKVEAEASRQRWSQQYCDALDIADQNSVAAAAAEVRVAELERERDRLRAWVDRIFADASVMQAAFDQARRSLDIVRRVIDNVPDEVWAADYDPDELTSEQLCAVLGDLGSIRDSLRAHPNTAKGDQ